jgi:hypothetical protein
VIKIHSCGCILIEGDSHYCYRAQPFVLIPSNLCSHDEKHQDFSRDCCGACGLTNERRFALRGNVA